MRNIFIFLTLALGLATGTAKASAIFTITQTPDFAMSGTAADTHIEEVWNFAGLPGWDPSFVIQNLQITEKFSNIGISIPGPNFQSTIIPYNTTVPNLGAAEFFLFTAQGVTATKSASFTVPGQIPIADLSNGGVEGQFDTRVGRNSGTFQLDSVTITLTVLTPEPATFALTALGLAAAICFARRRA
jgi:hypothetical protein